jgi:hypothetical protein
MVPHRAECRLGRRGTHVTGGASDPYVLLPAGTRYRAGGASGWNTPGKQPTLLNAHATRDISPQTGRDIASGQPAHVVMERRPRYLLRMRHVNVGDPGQGPQPPVE